MGASGFIDKVIYSEKVLCGRQPCLKPAAIAISGSRIAAVGNLEDIRNLANESAFAAGSAGKGGSTQFIDYEDACIYPGFHDAHMHVFHSALYSSDLAASFLGRNEQDCVRRMQDLALSHKDGWLLAQGWREYRWDIPKLPTKASLDIAFPNRPVALYSGDAHTLWLNSCALRELGIGEDSAAPEGGYYGRDELGKLTGIVGERAAMQLMPKIVSTFTDQQIQGAYRQFLSKLASMGITAVCDMSLMPDDGMDFIRDDVYSALLEQGGLTVRISIFPTLQDDLSRFERLIANDGGGACAAAGGRLDSESSSGLLRACGLKQFFDGVSSQHTAWLHNDYSNAVYTGDCGRPSIDPQDMRRMVLSANAKGYPVRIHTIGDEAIHEALDIFEESKRSFGALPNSRRNCLEHLENFQPQDIARIAELDVVASVQPAHITLDPGGPESDLGEARVPYMWPFRTLLASGAHLAFGTDSPVVAPSPLDSLYTAVTREDAHTHEPAGGWLPSERISCIEALHAYTEGSAYAAQRSHELGLISAGLFADLVVLGRDLVSCSPDDIQKTHVIATYVGGRPVFG